MLWKVKKTLLKLISHFMIIVLSMIYLIYLELILELEEYDKDGDWFNYDIKFSILDIDAKSYWRNNRINEYDYKTILKKYGGIYD